MTPTTTTEPQWRERYYDRLVELGLDEERAYQAASTVPVSLGEYPEDCAGFEAGYWITTTVEAA